MNSSLCSYVIEYAPHARSSCMECRQIILMGQIRLGVRHFWRHIECVSESQVRILLRFYKKLQYLPGLESLTRQDYNGVVMLFRALFVSCAGSRGTGVSPTQRRRKRSSLNSTPKDDPDEHNEEILKRSCIEGHSSASPSPFKCLPDPNQCTTLTCLSSSSSSTPNRKVQVNSCSDVDMDVNSYMSPQKTQSSFVQSNFSLNLLSTNSNPSAFCSIPNSQYLSLPPSRTITNLGDFNCPSTMSTSLSDNPTSSSYHHMHPPL